MKSFVRAVFLFTSLHFVLFFLCGLTVGFGRMMHAHEPTAMGQGFRYFFDVLSFPLGSSFQNPDAQLPVMPLFILLANSFIWGIGLSMVQLGLESAIHKDERPSIRSAQEKHLSFPLEVIFLFILLTLLWTAVSFFQVGFAGDGTEMLMVSYLKKLAIFPTVPFVVDEKTFEELGALGDIPLVLLNMLIWSILLAVLLRVFRSGTRTDALRSAE